MKFLVADISKYQNKIDYTKLAKTDVKGCIIRGAYRGYGKAGTLVTDPYFYTNVKGCINNNIPYGVYFFSQATTIAEAKEEANYVLELLKYVSAQPLFPIYIDSEYGNTLHTGRADKLSKAVRTEVVKAFCDTIEKAGYYAGIYASTSWFDNNLNDDQLLNYTHWVADYRGYCGYKRAYGMWQYTSSGKVDGISGRCDLNCCYKDFPSIIKNVGLNGYKKEEVKEPTKYYKFIVNEPVSEEVYNKLVLLGGTLNLDVVGSLVKTFTITTDEMTKGDIDKFKSLGDSLKINYIAKEI